MSGGYSSDFWVDSFDKIDDNLSDSFENNKILSFIRKKTNREYKEIAAKNQLRYLLKYLSCDHINAKTILYENKYIDKHFLEDYSEYYSRCFNSYDRFCSRIHFFSHSFTEDEFSLLVEKRIDSTTHNLSEKILKKSYLGYCVIRPVPKYFLGRICIKNYKYLSKKKAYTVITSDNKVNLFGLNLNVETIPLCEQDSIVAACATSALWTALKGHDNLTEYYMPSLSKITKIASKGDQDNKRVFPTQNLTPPQICAVYKKYELEPFHVKLSANDSLEEALIYLKICLNAFLPAKIPIIIGGKVYEKNGNEITCLGDHLITALGFHKTAHIEAKTQDFIERNEALGIDKCYTHDDRHGQYMRLSLNETLCLRTIESNTALEHDAIKVSIYENRNEFFKPEFLILGTNHKIRLKIWDIINLAEASYHLYNFSFELLSKNVFKKDVEFYEDLKNKLNFIKTTKWEINLTASNDYKSNLLKNQNFFHSSIAGSLLEFATQILPRYIWKASIKCNNTVLMDILFDATEILHGDVLLGFVCFDEKSQALIQYLDTLIASDSGRNAIDAYESKIPKKLQQHYKQIAKSFSKKTNRLDNLYGKPRSAARNLKPGELSKDKNIKKANYVAKVENGSASIENVSLSEETKYIWLVDEDANLIIAEDVKRTNESNGNFEFEGHVTLVENGFARVGGELYFEDKQWTINTKSGAYSKHINTEDKQNKILGNVKKYLFSKFSKLTNVNIKILK